MQTPQTAPRRLVSMKPRVRSTIGQGTTTVRSITGHGTTTVYARIKAGLFPPPIKLGRSSLWIEDELAAINDAVIAGSTDQELKKLVKNLLAARKQMRLTTNTELPTASAAQGGTTPLRRRTNRDHTSSSTK